MQNQAQQMVIGNQPISVAVTAPQEVVPMLLSGPTEEVLRICDNGDVIWRGRLVESDDDFKKAMLDMVDILKTMCTKGTY